MKFPNRVREVRTQLGLSRGELAQRVGVTRQSIGLIETGKVSPTTVTALRLARALGHSVEHLFHFPDDPLAARWVSAPHSVGDSAPQRAYLASIGGHWVARPATAASPLTLPGHAVAEPLDGARKEARLSLLQPLSEAEKTAFVSGCDPALGLLGQYAQVVAKGYRGVWFNAGNQQAIAELWEGATHVAAVHAKDEDALRALLAASPRPQNPPSDRPLHVLRLAQSQLGWVMSAKTRERFAGAESLVTERLRVVNREPGSGARTVLDAELTRARIDWQQVAGYHTLATSHLEVATAVKHGLADVGVAHAAAAAELGLAFVPIQAEVCFLLIRPDVFGHDAVQVLLEALQSDVFRTELSAFGPYDVHGFGNVQTWEVNT
ncbi:MAG: helix-turn-helix domain-containing protein [Alicyclobacillus herbarius]|uniref:substrate-binding domain-containing protein n=1 Tax=Alicyclobacillus herbarius TaxID=122960 RepID=UPI0023563B55|nr:substrate-binding domain-containing protein [Alicyclobacillus herbarius]MCL6631206.1 helix-turn-helix domain-containing protein [Alicyclobacillus herbarius]